MDFAAVLDAAAAIRGLLADHDEERTGLTPDDRIFLHRFATSVTDFAVALRAFRRYPEGQPADDAVADTMTVDDTVTVDTAFRTQVVTFGGWLPGSAFIAGAASQERGGAGLLERVRLAPYARIAIQMGIAIAGAISEDGHAVARLLPAAGATGSPLLDRLIAQGRAIPAANVGPIPATPPRDDRDGGVVLSAALAESRNDKL